MENIGRAQTYYERAESLRMLAAQDEQIETREALLAVARSYDRLATKFLDLAKRDPSPAT